MHAIEIDDDGQTTVLSFSRRYDQQALQQLAEQLGMPLNEDPDDEAADRLAH